MRSSHFFGLRGRDDPCHHLVWGCSCTRARPPLPEKELNILGARLPDVYAQRATGTVTPLDLNVFTTTRSYRYHLWRSGLARELCLTSWAANIEGKLHCCLIVNSPPTRAKRTSHEVHLAPDGHLGSNTYSVAGMMHLKELKVTNALTELECDALHSDCQTSMEGCVQTGS